MRNLAGVMRRRRFELAAWMTFEAAKNYPEADADVAEAIDFCEYYAEQALPLAEPLATYPHPGEDNSTRLVPLGTGVVICPGIGAPGLAHRVALQTGGRRGSHPEASCARADPSGY